MAKMIDVTYYRMNFYRMNNSEIGKIFTEYAINQVYFRDEKNNKLYFFQGEKKIYLPFAHNKSIFFKSTIVLYPIGIEITDFNNTNNCGTITQYLIDEKKYVVNDKSNCKKYISFKNAIAKE